VPFTTAKLRWRKASWRNPPAAARRPALAWCRTACSPQPGRIAIDAVGNVGLAGLMAASIAGCDQILAISMPALARGVTGPPQTRAQAR
jgi:hypothetical protein